MNDPKEWTSYIIYVVLLASVLAYVIRIYNTLVSLKNNVKKSFANIDVLLQQRNEELINLVEVVKGSAAHERELLEKLISLRSAYSSSTKLEHQVVNSNELTQTLRRLFVTVESYPSLNANTSFLKLQQRITEIEDMIADRREHFNNSVTLYNTEIGTFPYLIIANLFQYKEIPLLARTIDKKEAPSLGF